MQVAWLRQNALSPGWACDSEKVPQGSGDRAQGVENCSLGTSRRFKAFKSVTIEITAMIGSVEK